MSLPLSRFKPRLADLISFATLGAAVASMAFSLDGKLGVAGALILVGYVLDGADGEVARRLGGISAFGTQLDSLIDVVHFGAANSILISRHLSAEPLGGWPIWVLLAGYMFAACFRLARFNLTAHAGKPRETVGLTISTGGAVLALAVLADRALAQRLLPDWGFLLLLAAVSLLMASRVQFPDLRGLPRYWRPALATFAVGAVLMLWLPVEVGLLFVWTVYVLFGVARAGLRALVRSRTRLDSRQGSADQRSSA